jgi:hypothetical protein
MPLWTPAAITTNLWLDAADSSTLFDASVGGSLVADGGNVGRWEDKSGNARHAIQATSGNRPVRSGSSISFVDKWLSVPVSAWAINRMLIGVFNSSATGQLSVGLINIDSSPFDNPSLRWGIGDGTGNNCGHYWGGGFVVGATTNYGLATRSVHAAAIATAGVLTQWRNGTQTVTGTRAASWGSLNEFTLGKYLRLPANLGRTGAIDELIVCNSADRLIAEGYLAWKWGCEGDLPNDHPYKNAAPAIGSGIIPILRQHYAAQGAR